MAGFEIVCEYVFDIACGSAVVSCGLACADVDYFHFWTCWRCKNCGPEMNFSGVLVVYGSCMVLL